MSVSRAVNAGNSIVFMAAITGLYTEAASYQLSAFGQSEMASRTSSKPPLLIAEG
jgi:hypothetical protein